MPRTKQNNPCAEILGKSCRRIRKSKGYTIKNIAERSGLARSVISELELGQRNPTFAILCRVKEALGVSFKEIFEDLDEKDNMQSTYKQSYLKYVPADEEQISQ